MKLEKGLQSTHSLKKATYRMLRKLHSLEYRGALEKSQKNGNSYCVLLCLKHMSDVIMQSYEDFSVVRDLCREIDFLMSSIQKQKRVNRTLLVACLKKHTYVFNWLENNHIMVKDAVNEAREVWTMKCIPSYICLFENNI